MKPLLVTSGEPAGIGPDICLALADTDYPVVILGDCAVLEARAQALHRPIVFHPYDPHQSPVVKKGTLTVLSLPCEASVVPGVLNVKHADYVMHMLSEAARRVALGEFSGVVTAPVHKAILNDAGYAFTGHTEFFADYFKVPLVVMMLVSQTMKVALATTHLPLRAVPDAITQPLLTAVIRILHQALQKDFGVVSPCIHVAGLNPHAGESGHLGREEIEVIEPALRCLQSEDMNVQGPFSADTLFVTKESTACDAFLALYHDQGLPVIKYTDFGQGVNVTLGLPIIRTSVDHGTALALAGQGTADAGSLLAAVVLAQSIALQHQTQRHACTPKISLIAAIDKTGGLGKNNQLLCHLPADLKHFKDLTLGKPVVMGRKTFESIGKPLPNRPNIVVSRTMLPREGLVVVDSLEAALQVAKDAPQIMIIGGAQLFSEGLELAHTLYLTHIHHEFKADVFFPAFDEGVWHKEQSVFYPKDQHNMYDMSFCVYKRNS